MNDCYYGRRYCCTQNYCCPTRFGDDDCCNIRQNQSCCDYFPRSSQPTTSRRPLAVKKVGVEAVDFREAKRKSPTKGRSSGTSKTKTKKTGRMKANSDMMKDINIFGGNASASKLTPKVSLGGEDALSTNMDSSNPDAYDTRGSCGSFMQKSKQNLLNQERKQRMEVIDEEQEDMPSASDSQKKIQDSCMDFLSIVHDTVLETVQKSVDSILRDYFINSMDKIDCLCSQMMRNECLLSKMYLDIIDRISQQSEKSLRQFRCLCHFMAENRRNEQQQAQQQKCTCQCECPDDSNRREYTRSRPEDTSRQSYSGSKSVDPRYDSRARSGHTPAPFENHMSRNNVNYDDVPMMANEMRTARNTFRNADVKLPTRSTFRMNCCKLPVPNPCLTKFARCLPNCSGVDRNDARERSRHMELGESATSINEEIRKITELSTDPESTTATLTPSDLASDGTNRYTQTSRNSGADVIQRQRIARI